MPMTLHIVRLSEEEIRRRWPARSLLQAIFAGFDEEAAIAARWKLGRSRYDVQKQVPCTGESCELCLGKVVADAVF